MTKSAGATIPLNASVPLSASASATDASAGRTYTGGGWFCSAKGAYSGSSANAVSDVYATHGSPPVLDAHEYTSGCATTPSATTVLPMASCSLFQKRHLPTTNAAPPATRALFPRKNEFCTRPSFVSVS